jgi:hypothetical protein
MTLDLFPSVPKAPTKEQWLDQARDLARQIAEERGEVCADDIHEVLSIPQGVDRRTMGAVFEGMRWLGFTKSRRKECHYRPISRFTIGREA